jgi:hypothetical protein
LEISSSLAENFKKNMSDQTVGAYKVLSQEVEVEKSIKAVHGACWRSSENGNLVKVR